MNVRVGCDLVNIARFRRKIQNSPQILSKVFSPQELQNKDPVHLAGIFAAKEATIKALDLPMGSWHQFRVVYRQTGKPSLIFAPKHLESKIKSCDLSITTDGHYAQSTFIAILK